MKVIRLYYNKAGEIIWTSGLEGTGEFPRSIDQELTELPPGTQCLILDKEADILDYEARKAVIVEGKVAGTLRPVVIPQAPRDALKEIDALQSTLRAKGVI